ncbi:hypothetical protein HZ994_18210 [Akkermansiaceae bacterium]|nr:hypothetical protein HZ994_18210 [Akkermansiaceae bacterium]
MHQESHSHLKQLLTTFNATSLGEGNINAGANVLATMAVTLANVARTGSGIGSPQTGRMRVGASLLVSGGLTTSLVRDDVITETAVRQNNLLAQLRRLIGDKIADAKRDGLGTVEFPSGPKANYSGNALYRLEHSDPLVPEDVVESWKDVIGLPPNPRIEDLAAHPKILVTAKTPRHLDKQLVGLHHNRPLVVLGLNSAADASSMSETCNALLNGTFPCGEWGETAAGNFLITDPGTVLCEIAQNSSGKATWHNRMVWLVDGNLGPDAVEDGAGEGMVRADNMTGRFGEALSSAFAKRLNNHDASPTIHAFDLTRSQLRWVKFLEGMESRLPGITGTARSLLATLSFGLIELANASPRQRLPLAPSEVEALARWVILRMANARAAMLGSAERESLQELARRVHIRLSEGRLPKRDIYRSLRISASQCDELLLRLQSARWVQRIGNEWESTKAGMLQKQELENLFIDV